MYKIIVLFCFLNFFTHTALAGKDPNKEEAEKGAHFPPRLPSNSLVLRDSTTFYSSGGDFSQDLILAGVGRSIPLRGFPHLSHDMLYVIDTQGNLHTYGYSQGNAYRICIYGPDIYGLVGFVTEGGESNESFSYAIHHTTRYEYNPPISYPELKKEDKTHTCHKYNKCHKLGREHTIPQPHNSNSAANNFYAGCWALNQGAENALIATGLGAYGKVLLYEDTPRTITQKIKGTPRNTGREQTKIFSGLIFKSFYWDGNVRIHYLPHDKGSGETHQCFYYSLKNIYNHYAHILGLFEIQNSAQLFQPLMWDLRRHPDELLWMPYKAFYQGLNLRSTSSLNDIWAFLKELGLPFSWNGFRGYNKEEIQRIVSEIHRKTLNGEQTVMQTIGTPPPHFMVWNNFRLLSYQRGELSWEDATDKEIPLIPRIVTLPHRDFFLNYLSLRLLEDAAKYQTDSIAMKMGLSKIYFAQGNYKKAKEWINQAYRQCFESHSLSESLKLARLYLAQWSNLPPTIISPETFRQDIGHFLTLLHQKKQHTFLEELLDLEKFNTEMVGKIPNIPTELEKVKEISTQNSNILKNEFISSKNVKILVDLLKRTKSLEKIDLKDAFFIVDQDECVRTFSIGEDEWDAEKGEWVHISDDGDWVDKPISEEEFFWDEEKPLSQVLAAIEKNHGHSLKILNLSGITFNGFSEGAEVLKTLRNLKMDALEDLYLMDNLIDGSDTDAKEALRNLSTCFPRLQNIFFGETIDDKYTLKDLPFLANRLTPFLRKDRQLYKISRRF